MKKTFKKITASIMAVTTLAVSIVGMSANAANIENTDIDNFSAPPSISNTYLAVPEDENGVRVKDNNSSVYLYITSSPYNLFVQTWGLSDANWSSSTANRTCNANGASTTHVTVTPGRRYVIKNLINERGDRCAGLKFCSSSYYNYAAIQGVWSPDFSGNPNLNVTVAN